MTTMFRIILPLALVLWATAAQAAMTCSASNVSAVAINTSTTSLAATMPTAAPAGATLFAAVRNRTAGADLADSVTGDTNGAFTLGGNNTSGSGYSTALYYKLNATAATDTVTTTWTGLHSVQLIVGWCADDAGAQTFDTTATVATTTGTNHDSNTLSASGGGGIIGVIGTNNSVTYTADGAGETEISGDVAGQRISVFFEAYTGAGTYGLETTSNASTTSYFTVTAFLTPAGGGATCTGGLTLLGAGKCDE